MGNAETLFLLATGFLVGYLWRGASEDGKRVAAERKAKGLQPDPTYWQQIGQLWKERGLFGLILKANIVGGVLLVTWLCWVLIRSVIFSVIR